MDMKVGWTPTSLSIEPKVDRLSIPWWESGRSVAALLLFLNATALLWYFFLVDYRWQVFALTLLFYMLADVAAMTRRA